jgi:transcriptional regulator with XRE-family HTH domain
LTHLADAAGLSRSHLWIVLRGESAASLDILAKLAATLGVDPVALVRPYRDKPPASPADDE